MDVKKLQVLLEIERCGSFTKAGDRLGYTQSGITQMMKSLEKEIGFPLFDKTHKGVTLTTSAKSLLPSVHALIAADEVLNQEISFLKGAKKGTIKIGTYVSCSIHWLPSIIQKFQMEHPDILFEIMEGDEQELTDWVLSHKVDVGFLSYHPREPYEFIKIMDDPMLAVFPKGHPFEEHEEIPLEWYQNVPFVISDYTYENDVYRILSKNKIKPEIKYTTTNDYSILSLVEHNLGISILPALILRGRVGNYEARPLVPRTYRSLGIAISSKEDLSPAAKIFIKYAQNYLLD